jgi:hypothetical protein
MVRRSKISEVLERFKAVHGDEFDYSKVQYVNARTKVEIICPVHGSFFQTPDHHLRNRKCPKCSGKGKSREEKIKDFRKVHGNKYDYSKAEIKTTKSKIKITCPVHGEFLKTPEKHKAGQGCPQCAEVGRVEKRKTSKHDLLQQFKNAHGNKYDYEQMKYVNTSTPIMIICKEHGQFEQMPSKHIIGQGCPKCVGKGLTKEELIKFFKDVHNNKYSYTLPDDFHVLTKIKIECPNHGEFNQTVDSHKQGRGCPDCGLETVAAAKRKSRAEIIAIFQEVHGNKYDYSRMRYKDKFSKIIITCPHHGQFFQVPHNHAYGQGCPMCTLTPQSKQELQINFELQLFFPKIDSKGFKTRINGKLWSVDIYIPEINLGIEFDGSYWHKGNEDLDKMKTRELQKEGFEILRIREEPLMKINELDIISKVPFKGKNVVDKVLRFIEHNCPLKEDITNRIKQYLIQGKMLNKSKLEGYINSVMEQRIESKRK